MKYKHCINYYAGIAIGMSVNEFNEVKDLEIVTFRRDILSVCVDAVNERSKLVNLTLIYCIGTNCIYKLKSIQIFVYN